MLCHHKVNWPGFSSKKRFEQNHVAFYLALKGHSQVTSTCTVIDEWPELQTHFGQNRGGGKKCITQNGSRLQHRVQVNLVPPYLSWLLIYFVGHNVKWRLAAKSIPSWLATNSVGLMHSWRFHILIPMAYWHSVEERQLLDGVKEGGDYRSLQYPCNSPYKCSLTQWAGGKEKKKHPSVIKNKICKSFIRQHTSTREKRGVKNWWSRFFSSKMQKPLSGKVERGEANTSL